MNPSRRSVVPETRRRCLTVLYLGGKGNLQEGWLRAELQGLPTVDDMRTVQAIFACLDDLPRARARVNKAIGGIVATVHPRRQIDDCNSGPVMTGRGVDHRHPAVHRAVVPVGVVDEDLIGADDFDDDGDMTGRDALRPLEDEDRSHCRGMSALIPADGLIPPPACVAEQSNTGLRACIKRAIGSGRRPGGYDQTRNEKRAPNEAVRQHRSHLISPKSPTARSRLVDLPVCRRLRFVNDFYET